MVNLATHTRRPQPSASKSGERRPRLFDGWSVVEVALLWGLVIIPLFFVASRTFLVDGLPSVQNFVDLFQSIGFLQSLGLTLFGSAIGTLIALVLGTVLALVSERLELPGIRILRVVAFVPLFISPLGGAIAWVLLGNPNVGLLWSVSSALGLPISGNLYTFEGIVFVLSLFYTPYVYVVISNALGRIDGSLEEAAATFGARGAVRITRVLLPLLKVPAASSALVVFVHMVGSFAPPTLLGSPGGVTWLSTFAYESIVEFPVKPGQAGSVAVVMIAIVSIVYFLRSRVLASARGVTTIGGKGFHAPPRVRAGVLGWIGVGISIAYVFVSCVLPILVLVMATTRAHMFVRDIGAIFDSSLYSLDRVLTSSSAWLPVLGNTIVVCGSAAVIGALLAFIANYLTNGIRATRAKRILTNIPIATSLAVPGLVFGLAYLWAGVWTPIYGSLFLMVLAFVGFNVGQAYQAQAGAFLQVGRELEESAAVFGARTTRRMFGVVLPSLASAVISSCILTFIFAVRELSPVLFIYTPSTRVLAVQAFQYWYDGQFGMVALITLVESLLMLAALLLSQFAVRRWRQL